MKNAYIGLKLMPYTVKIIGQILLIITILLFPIGFFVNTDMFQKYISNEHIKLLMILALTLIAFSKEKRFDELLMRIRIQNLATMFMLFSLTFVLRTFSDIVGYEINKMGTFHLLVFAYIMFFYFQFMAKRKMR